MKLYNKKVFFVVSPSNALIKSQIQTYGRKEGYLLLLDFKSQLTEVALIGFDNLVECRQALSKIVSGENLNCEKLLKDDTIYLNQDTYKDFTIKNSFQDLKLDQETA
jgi:hypothetical protein